LLNADRLAARHMLQRGGCRRRQGQALGVSQPVFCLLHCCG